MGRNLSELFKNRDKEPEEVIIFSNDQDNSLTPTEITAPAGVNWMDFDRIEITYAYGWSLEADMTVINSDKISKSGGLWGTRWRYTQGGVDVFLTVSATALDTITLTYSDTSKARVSSIIGYKKRYVTENFCRDIILKAGAKVVAGETLNVDIATYLGKDYLNQDLLVETWLYNDSGNGVEDWFKVDTVSAYVESGEYRRGIRSEVKKATGQIWVGAGATALNEPNTRIPNSVGLTTALTSAKVMLKVWRISALNILLAGGGSGSGIPTFQVIRDTAELASGAGYAVDTSSGSVAVSLPSNPKAGDTCYIKDYAGTATVNNSVIINSFKPIHGKAMQYAITSRNCAVCFSFIDEVMGWCIVGGVGLEGGGIIPYEEVEILAPVARNSNDGSGSLPNNLTWSDFERIEISIGLNTNHRNFGSQTITKEEMAARGDGTWIASQSYITQIAATRYNLTVHAAADGTFTWEGLADAPSTAYPYSMKGYTKYKPSTQKGLVRLYQGPGVGSVTGETLTLEHPITDFDLIHFTMKHNFGIITAMLTPDQILDTSRGERYISEGRLLNDNAGYTVRITGTPTTTSMTIIAEGNSLAVDGVVEVRGVNFINPAGTNVEKKYPTKWQSAANLLDSRWITDGPDGLMAKWVSEDTFVLKGIIRSSDGGVIANGVYPLLTLPSISNLTTTQWATLGMQADGAASRSYSYMQVDPNASDVELATAGHKDGWLMVDSVEFVLKPID